MLRIDPPDLRVVWEHYGGSPKETSGEQSTRCPVHDDNTPSASVNTGSGLWHCHACGNGGDVYELIQIKEGLTRDDFAAVPQSRRALLQRATREYADQLSSDQATSDYLEGRSPIFRRDTGTRRGSPHRSRGMTSTPAGWRFPHRTEGNVYDIRYRCLENHVCKDVGCPKYLGDAGVETRLYNTRSLVASTDYIPHC